MSATSSTDRTNLPPKTGQSGLVGGRIGAVELFILSAWCGLASGLLEVGLRVVCRAIDPSQRLYLLSRHFLWLGPLSSLLFFLGMWRGPVGGC